MCRLYFIVLLINSLKHCWCHCFNHIFYFHFIFSSKITIIVALIDIAIIIIFVSNSVVAFRGSNIYYYLIHLHYSKNCFPFGIIFIKITIIKLTFIVCKLFDKKLKMDCHPLKLFF